MSWNTRLSASCTIGTFKSNDDGLENLVQRDEPDPLGSTQSVVRILRQQGLPIQEDTRLRVYTLSEAK